MSDGIWWSAKLGGLWLMWPETTRSPDLAKMMRTSKAKAKAMYDASTGARHERIAKILTRAATGRIVALEEIDLRPAMAADLALWRRLHHVDDVVHGRGTGPPAEQISLL